MAFHYSPKVTTDGLCFAWDGMNHKCWDGGSVYHYDLVSGGQGEKQGSNTLSRGYGSVVNHVYFSGGAINRSCYISFPSANITVPTGDTGTWMWTQYFVDSGNIDHPNFGKETTGTWSGTNGFVFGTGWGTDGPRWGIGGSAYQVYATTGGTTGDYRGNKWQIYAVTYERNTTNGLKTYLFDDQGQRLVDQRNSNNNAIGSNSNALHIGATNIRSGQWQGFMDSVYMWTRVLTPDEIYDSMNTLQTRFGL